MSTRAINELMRQKENGRVIIKGKEIDFESNRQGVVKWLLHRKDWDKVGAPGWHMFINHIQKHSGKHIHQGGLVLFVLEGEGYTVVDGQRFDWQKDDLIVLPVKPGGCEHQHFNIDPACPAEWLAFIYHTMGDVVSVGKHQVEEAPGWKRPGTHV